MKDKKEIILLDACIEGVIDKRAFHAILRNVHSFVAFKKREDFCVIDKKIGDKVKVKFSPFDMSKGEIFI